MRAILRQMRRTAVHLLVLYLVFAFAGSSLVLLFDQTDGFAYADQIDSGRFFSDEQGADRIVLLADRVAAGRARIQLIGQAHKTLDIALHSIMDGTYSDFFYASILDAADRGVQVRLLFDGIFNNLHGSLNKTRLALAGHPNIALAFYEPPGVFTPWRWNNRLHDKFMIVDQTFVLIGGGNVEDRYYLDEYEGEAVYDLHAVICRNWQSPAAGSVLGEFDQYFTLLWLSEFSRAANAHSGAYRFVKAAKRKEELLALLHQARQAAPERYGGQSDWHALSLPTNKISLIHNPLMQLNKEPWILSELSALMQHAEHTVMIQSPYIIPTKQMMNYIDLADMDAELLMVTNSLAASPNYFAMAGYKKHRKAILNRADEVYEYHGPGSLHAKAYIIDLRLSLVGSFNVDARSAFLSTESMVVIDSEIFADRLHHCFGQITGLCLPANQALVPENNPVQPRHLPWYKGLAVRILSVLLYPFDFLL